MKREYKAYEFVEDKSPGDEEEKTASQTSTTNETGIHNISGGKIYIILIESSFLPLPPPTTITIAQNFQ